MPRALRTSILALALAAVLAACAGGSSSPAADGPAAGSPTVGASPGGGAAASPLDFTAETVSGSRLDAATLAGKPTVLWFWAPWCTVCRAEGPDVAAVAKELGGDVQIVGVAGRGEVPAMRDFVSDTGTGQITHLVDADGSLWAKFGVVSQPAFAFVAKDGSVRMFQGSLGEQDLRSQAEELASA